MKFLVFQHVPHESPGMFFEAAAGRDAALEIIELWKTHEIPKADGFDALMIMGGPMGVNDIADTYPSKEKEITFIRAALGKLPMIGFCLGAQLIAHALGARVYSNLTGGKRVKEVGYSTVELTAEGVADPLFEGFQSPITVLQLHGDAFDLPEGAVLLASSSVCQIQAFRWGDRTYGTLFHNEFTSEMVDLEIELDRGWIHRDVEVDEEELRKKARSNAGQMRAQCNQLFENFCHIVESV